MYIPTNPRNLIILAAVSALTAATVPWSLFSGVSVGWIFSGTITLGVGLIMSKLGDPKVKIAGLLIILLGGGMIGAAFF